MNETIQFLLRHGYAVVFAFVFAEQIGIPIPSTPVLLAMGALAGDGRISFSAACLAAITASVLADSIWFWLGRKRGYAVLNLLCRIALEPDSCVRKTENVFTRFGSGALVFAKFVPGLSTAAPPLAGLVRMSFLRFVLADAAGSALWIGLFGGAGYLFRSQLERVAAYALSMGTRLILVMIALLAAYVLWKVWERQRFLRRLRVARITPDDLLRQLNAGEAVMIVDLRSSLDAAGEGMKLPGALHLSPDELDQRHGEIPRDREIVLYCT